MCPHWHTITLEIDQGTWVHEHNLVLTTSNAPYFADVLTLPDICKCQCAIITPYAAGARVLTHAGALTHNIQV